MVKEINGNDEIMNVSNNNAKNKATKGPINNNNATNDAKNDGIDNLTDKLLLIILITIHYAD